MKWQPRYYRTHPQSQIVCIESVIVDAGDLMFAVTIDSNEHYLFQKMSSAIDFVNSNFK